MRRIVILGAGFGGLHTALSLAKRVKEGEAEVLLVDRNSYQTYTPSLYEVATAYRGTDLGVDARDEEFLSSVGGSVAFDIKDILAGSGVSFVQDTVVGIDAKSNTVLLQQDGPLSYDYLVIALGSTTAFYGVEGACENCVAMKSISDALRLRQQVESALRKQQREVVIAVVGGGLTGFEVVTEMCSFVEHLKRRYSRSSGRVKLVLLEAGETILAAAPPPMRARATERLGQLGVKVMTGTRISRVEEGKLYFAQGGFLRTDVQMWSGGVKGHEVVRRAEGLPLNQRGQVEVNEFLTTTTRHNVFAIGDAAAFFDKKANVAAPATAWAAEQQAEVAAENIAALLRGEKPRGCTLTFPGFVSAAGGKYAIAHLFGITITGLPAWALKRLIDLKYLLSLYAPLSAVLLWARGVRLFARND